MTNSDDDLAPALVRPDAQQAVLFLGALARIRVGGDATGGRLAVLEHEEERGHRSPLHRHDRADETFLVLDGELRVRVDGETLTAGAGAAAFLPRRLPHAFAVSSSRARFLTLHTPAGFELFTLAAASEPPDRAALTALARSYGIEILGPPPPLLTS